MEVWKECRKHEHICISSRPPCKFWLPFRDHLPVLIYCKLSAKAFGTCWHLQCSMDPPIICFTKQRKINSCCKLLLYTSGSICSIRVFNPSQVSLKVWILRGSISGNSLPHMEIWSHSVYRGLESLETRRRLVASDMPPFGSGSSWMPWSSSRKAFAVASLCLMWAANESSAKTWDCDMKLRCSSTSCSDPACLDSPPRKHWTEEKQLFRNCSFLMVAHVSITSSGDASGHDSQTRRAMFRKMRLATSTLPSCQWLSAAPAGHVSSQIPLEICWNCSMIRIHVNGLGDTIRTRPGCMESFWQPVRTWLYGQINNCEHVSLDCYGLTVHLLG